MWFVLNLNLLWYIYIRRIICFAFSFLIDLSFQYLTWLCAYIIVVHTIVVVCNNRSCKRLILLHLNIKFPSFLFFHARAQVEIIITIIRNNRIQWTILGMFTSWEGNFTWILRSNKDHDHIVMKSCYNQLPKIVHFLFIDISLCNE